MNKIIIGDFVKGIKGNTNKIINENLVRAVIVGRDETMVKIKIMDHLDGIDSVYWFNEDKFEVIGHKKEFDKVELLDLLYQGNKKALFEYDLCGADLRDADLRRADLDFSCLPLWCGGLNIKIDKRIACQLAYHLCSMDCDDAEFIKMRNYILEFANQFHIVNECGRLTEIEIQNDKILEESK